MATTLGLPISEVAQLFDVTTRTIRYYEEVGLLSPVYDESGVRRFQKRDLARLKLILRGKRLGFRLAEIREMILLFNEDRTGRKQLERTITYGEQKIQEVDERIEELHALRHDLMDYKEKFQQKYRALQGESGD
ncbi:MerR family DNA-binding protein [Bacillus fonticola]|uniref:MerR family DNA-binding protein n=1 Tax=Bacillus fonticola TaxID=2728853 RepID=UPI001476436B|nr:MerR family transcriptional regulator [Bacillus fonticola]